MLTDVPVGNSLSVRKPPCSASARVPGVRSRNRFGGNSLTSLSKFTSARLVLVFIASSMWWVGWPAFGLVKMVIGRPVVIRPYMPAALMPMPCWPRLIFRRWNFEPYSSRPKMFSTCLRTMPGPLSMMVTRYRELLAVAGRPGSRSSTITAISGRMPASSHASSELSTASLTVVSIALRGLSKPSRWRFFAKNSLTLMSRWRAAMLSASARGATDFFFFGSAIATASLAAMGPPCIPARIHASQGPNTGSKGRAAPARSPGEGRVR